MGSHMCLYDHVSLLNKILHICLMIHDTNWWQGFSSKMILVSLADSTHVIYVTGPAKMVQVSTKYTISQNSKYSSLEIFCC